MTATRSALQVLVSVALIVTVASCNKAASTDASKPLQQSFQTADPAAKQAAETAAADLKAGRYAESLRSLAFVADQRNLTEPQKQAIGMTLQQINSEIAKNPALDTKEMYQLRLKMHQAVDGGKRF